MTPTPPAYHPHDHHHCVEHALQEARELCRRAGTRLTPIREQVLQLVWQSHKPLGAYDLLAELGGKGRPAAPPTVYRALDFLQGMGLVHRIASLNAFIGCPHPDQPHSGLFLICQDCRIVLELPAPEVDQAIRRTAEQQGFQLERMAVEVSGQCPRCHEGTTP